MSVEYFFNAVWGIAGEFEELSDLPGHLSNWDWDDLHSEREIEPGVQLFVGGNQMSGPHYWCLLVRSSWVRCDKRGENYPNGALPGVTKLEEPTTTQKQTFGLAQHELGLTDFEPGWLFLVDVS